MYFNPTPAFMSILSYLQPGSKKSHICLSNLIFSNLYDLLRYRTDPISQNITTHAFQFPALYLADSATQQLVFFIASIFLRPAYYVS